MNKKSTEDKLWGWFDLLSGRGTGFFYLGSRNEIDYGIMLGSSSTDRLPADFVPELQAEKKSSAMRCLFYTGVSNTQETMVAKGNEDHQEKSTTGATHLSAERLRGKPDVGRILQVGPLVTYSKEEGWNDVRFSVTKCLEDDSFWLVAQPAFYGDDDGDEVTSCYAEPHERSFPLDGFESPISCARLKANEESLKYCAEMQQLEGPKRTHASKPFDIEQVHSGGFYIMHSQRQK
ncbi:hypothetical protein EV356DRAFT_91 [Viridothelium virens]|uniref:Uncharacterized protein n=1 Tax=Viridothelium virens TaxID=1048519 RepID=A0A6A6HQS3_VIRVR|nr:hypothetical protein EV356DRAFT_91 [Viridothelium virens]